MEPNELRDLLATAVLVSRTDDGLRASTHCLYPSNGAVMVVVRGRGNEFVVSDDGGAVAEIMATGREEVLSDRQIKALVKGQGLKVSNGVIYSPVVPAHAVHGAALLVANAPKEVADWGLEHIKFRVARNFKAELAALLDRHFRDNLKHNAPILGASNKEHKFTHVIYLDNGRRLLIDPAINDSSSINSRLVANLDVKMAHDPAIEQLIVYDDALDWAASDLKLLSLGARTVPFSRAEPEITRLAA